ncbi:MAG: AzlD domain-containing protein [Anaerolineae bacterium]|nr:AzlD domain-containing protein [Anaerolineae bacterium]
MSGLWLALIAAGVLTLLTRLSFIWMLNKWQPPEWFRRGLRFVPLAVLTALIFPDVLMQNGQLALPPDLPRLLGATIAILVAWRSKNIFLTIGAGMVVFYLLRWLIG